MLRRNQLKLKRLLIILSLLCCFSACRSQIQREDEKPLFNNPENLPTANKTSSSNTMTQQNSNLNTQSVGKAEIAYNSKKIIVLDGVLTLKSEQLELGKEWRDDSRDTPQIRLGMVFDLLNCAGYIGQARIVKNLYEEKGYYGWEMKLIKESNRPNVKQAISQCPMPEEELDEGVSASSPAFAVYPSQPDRRNIRINKVPNLKAIYDSLSEEQKQWRASLNEQRKPEFFNTLENDFNWTDTDGDGKIDLISIEGTCNGKPDTENHCIKILHLFDGKWLEVVLITPA